MKGHQNQADLKQITKKFSYFLGRSKGYRLFGLIFFEWICQLILKGCMLYTMRTKFSPEEKKRTPRSSQKEKAFDDIRMPMPKNVLGCLKNIIMQKHGRKLIMKQSKQIGQKHTDRHQTQRPTRISHLQPQRRKYICHKYTIDWDIRPTTITRTTQNLYGKVSDRQEYKDVETACKKKNEDINKNTLTSSLPVSREQTIDRTPFQKKLMQIRAKISSKNLGFIRKQQRRTSGTRIKMPDLQYNCISLQESQEQEGSLVGLITKYEFQNLKTAQIPSSLEPHTQTKKYTIKLIQTQPKQETVNFFTEDHNIRQLLLKQNTERHQNKTLSHRFRNYQHSLTSFVSHLTKPFGRKSNPLITPWATETDSFAQDSPLPI